MVTMLQAELGGTTVSGLKPITVFFYLKKMQWQTLSPRDLFTLRMKFKVVLLLFEER